MFIKFLSKCSSIYRENISAKIISITGSCGKTTLKEMIAYTLKVFQKHHIRQNHIIISMEFQLSIFNLKQNDDFGS